MAIHSGILAWRIPWTEDPGGTVCSVAKSQTGLKQLSTRAFKKKKKRCGAAGCGGWQGWGEKEGSFLFSVPEVLNISSKTKSL